MNRSLDMAVSSVLLIVPILLFLVTLTDTFDVPTFGGDVGPAFAPRAFLVVWAVLAAIAVYQAAASRTSTEKPGDSNVNTTQLFLVMLITIATGVGMTYIGFVFAAIPGFFLFCLAFGYRKIPLLVVLSILCPLAIWAIFTYGFELLLPRSPWLHMM